MGLGMILVFWTLSSPPKVVFIHLLKAQGFSSFRSKSPARRYLINARKRTLGGEKLGYLLR